MLTVSAEGAAGLSLSLDASIPAEYFVYSGTAKEPAVVVKDGEQTLTKDQDYTVSYSNNINAGENTAVATVTGIGNYSDRQGQRPQHRSRRRGRQQRRDVHRLRQRRGGIGLGRYADVHL